MTYPRSNRPPRALAASGALLAALLVLVGCGEAAEPPELPPRAIKWQRVSGTYEGGQRVISGIVTAVSDTRLAFDVGGTVKTVEVNMGDQVERGQVLARLDPEPFELTVHDAQAALAEARALQQSARADYSRAKSLYEAEVSSRQEFDRATALRDSRDSQVEATQARLDLARRDLRRSELLAPFTGAISVREIDPAMEVAGGQMVFEMDSEESGLRVEVQLPETLIARVKQGDAVEVTFPSLADSRPGGAERERFPARVSEVGTRAGVGNAFPVRADLDGQPPGVRPGMTAEATFSIPREESGLTGIEGFMIPIAAARAEAGDGFSVFVFDNESSTVSRVPIVTGGVGDNTIAVLEGLAEGDIIATAGVSFLRDGQQVTLLDERLIRNAR
jgi:RND family efflux transporter MFP subunit